MSELICHCFGYTALDIAQDAKANGRSLISERIARAKAQAGCDCQNKNPSGR